MTLIGVPAALFGAYSFSGEIVDSFTRPDVAMSIDRMTLRCFFSAKDQDQLNEIVLGGNQELTAEICGKNDLSIGFEASFENQDRIVRTITNATAKLHLPGSAPVQAIDLDHPWLAIDEFKGYGRSVVRRPLPALPIPYKTTQRHELWIKQAAPRRERTSWEPVRTWLASESHPPDEEAISAEIFLTIAGEGEPIRAATCSFVPMADSLQGFRRRPLHNQVAFTADCRESQAKDSADTIVSGLTN